MREAAGVIFVEENGEGPAGAAEGFDVRARRESRGGVYDPTLSTRTPLEVRQALEAYATFEGMKLSKAASTVLEDWLRTHGWLAGTGQKPTGPATDVVDAMDTAIKGDRAKKKPSAKPKKGKVS